MKEQAFANSVTTVSTVLFLICAAWAFLSPLTFAALVNSWFHGFDFTSLAPKSFSLGQFLYGLVSFVLIVWVLSYSGALLYKRFSK